jgi:hypothetical protein
MLAGLVRAGLATMHQEAGEAGGLQIKSERYGITAAGWQALERYPARMSPPDAR